MRAGLLLLALAVASLVASARAEAGCRAGTEEYTRTTDAQGNTHVYCVCSADLARLRDTDGKLRALDEAIKETRAKIEEFQAEVPEYLASLDEWVKEDEEGRKEKMAKARSAAISIAIQSLRLAALQQNARMTPADAEAFWAKVNAGPLGSPAFQQALQRVAPGARLHPWHTSDEVLEGLETIHLGVEGMKAGWNGQYGDAAVSALTLLIHDPKLAILVAEVDFTATAILSNSTARVARARVEQLSTLGETRLKAIASLGNLYKKQIDERKRLQPERVDLINRGSNPNVACR